FKEFVLEKKVAESDVITSFYLKPKDESKVPSYVAGQYLTVRVKPEGAEHNQIRHYTLSTKSNEDYFRISVKNEDVFETNGVVSCHLHDHVHEGDTVEVSAPAGLFTLEEDDQAPIALVSGGVGITPMISMLDQLVAENSNRHVTFLHAAQRSEEHTSELQSRFHLVFRLLLDKKQYSV